MKELIELLRYTEVNGDRDPQNYVTNLCGSCYLCEQAADALERLEKQVPKWIPVTERLPENREDVLVVAFWHERWNVQWGWYAPNGKVWHIGLMEETDYPVSYWMPLPQLPQPPKGE